MRKIILYIACSLDGKIADADGSTDWLHQIPNPDNSDYGYSEFFKSIDTTLMGNKTYKQVLGFDCDFPYKDTKNFVFTRDQLLTKNEHVEYISENFEVFIKNLKRQSGKDIWCIGGGAVNGLLLNHGLIDEIQLFMMPVILGDGINLVDHLGQQINLDLKHTTEYKSGVIELRYKISHS